ncbi:MAG: DUF5106 domain-containing protein [Bacteroides sp.]|nr:DUF5106 domain-containing protein [Bacteroides sp.]
MKRINYIALAVFFLCCSCKNGNASGNENSKNPTTPKQETVSKDSVVLSPIKYPEIPTIFTQPEQRADFLAEHFWEHFNFADTNYINKPEITEQFWVDYINILGYTPQEKAKGYLKDTFRKAEQNKKMYNYLVDLADKYLYDPNSPFRQEEYYIAVLESMVASPILQDIEKIRPKDRLKIALKNRVGEKASNFTYTLESGKQGKLYQIKSDYIILFFNNPGCSACEEAIKQLKYSLAITKAVMDKELTILAIYADQDLDEWKKYRNEFPQEWINGYDKEQVIEMNRVYDLKASPTIYLLDKDKKVILKDTTVGAIETYLKARM